jgi:hypothetical protein
MYGTLSDMITKRKWMTDDEFLGKQIKLDKIIELKEDLEQKIANDKDNPKVPGDQKAVDLAALEIVNKNLQEKMAYDDTKKIAEDIKKVHASNDVLQKRLEATRAEQERKSRLKKEGRRADKHKAINKQKEAERETARKTSAYEERRKAVQAQTAKTRKTPATPVSEERKYELEQSKARKAAQKKQAEEVAKLDRKSSGLPKKVDVKDLQSEKSEYVILSPDNPMSSKDTPAYENRRARIKLQKELDDLGIDYETTDSYFEDSVEKAFIIKGMTKEEGKALSDRLQQTSYIHGKGKYLDLIEGDEVRRVLKSDAKVAQNPMAYTMIQGKKWAAPFYTDKESIINFESAQISEEEVQAAKSAFRAAAIKFKGKVYEGASHASIIMQNDTLQDALIDMPTYQIHSQFDHGFVTHDGKFVDRMKAGMDLGLKQGNYLQSEAFLSPTLDVKAEQMEKEAGIGIDDFAELPLKEKMGYLEIADSLKQEMDQGRYKWLFNRSKKAQIETVFITNPGQYGKHEVVKRFYPDMKSKEDAVNRFEGGVGIDPATGQMKTKGGVKGVYIKADKMKGNPFGTAFINLMTIAKRTKTIGKALETIVHEHIHGEVDRAVQNMPREKQAALKKDLEDLWNSIPKEFVDQTLEDKNTHIRVGAGIIQIRRDGIGELITYAMSHPEFAAWLNTIPASPKFRAQSKGVKTIWDVLARMVGKILNVPTKFNEVLDVLNKHMELGIKEDVRFSKEDTSFDFGANVTKDNVQEWVKELDDAAVNSLPTEVVENAEEAEKILGYNPGPTAVSFWVPESQTEKPYGAKKSWKPQIIPGRVVLIADRIQSQEHAVSKWMHEQVGHQGLHNIFPTKHSYESFMEQAYGLFAIKDSAVLAEVIELYDIGKLDAKTGKRKLTFTEKVKAAEELIGSRAETLSPTSKKGLIAKLKAFLSRWLPKVFVGKENKFKLNDNDVWNIIRMARENVITGNSQFSELIQKAMNRRAPKVKFQKWKTLPPFMETDETYKEWMREVRKQAPQMVKWYTQHKNTLVKIFGKDADLFNVLLSVTSPNADVETNVLFAAQTYAYLMGATDRPGALYVNKLQTRIDEKWTSVDAMFRNLESNLFKVTEFVRALMGDPDATVGDMWMYRAFFGDPLSNNQKDEKFSVPQTIAMRQKLHDLAAQMSDETGETWTPREVQAAIWVWINAKQTGTTIQQIATYESGLNRPFAKLDGKTPLQWLTEMFPNMQDGILGEKMGVKMIPMAPISPLEKKLLGQIDTELKAKKSKPGYKVDEDGVIEITPSENKRLETVRMMRAIVAGGREIVVNDDITGDWIRQTFGFQKVGPTENGKVTMRLRPDAENLFKSQKTGKVTFGALRDNLGGFSGTYTQEVRFSREATQNLEQIRDMSTDQIDANFLKTGNQGRGVVEKIHEWRDQSELNWNRFTDTKEQDFLERFGGTKSKVKVLGSGRYLNNPKTELLQKAMNLYIDSGSGKNLEKVHEYLKKMDALEKKGMLTNRQKQHVAILEKMLNLSTQEKAYADSEIRPYYEDAFQFAQDNKLIDSHVDNYVKRSWKMPKHLKDADISWSGSGTSGIQLTLDSGKKRTLDSIVDGWENGMDLKTEGVLQNLQQYGVELGYTFANRRFIRYMRGLVDFSADSLMYEVNSKKNPDFKTPDGFVKLTDRGFAKPGHIIYARKDIGTLINKLGARPSHQIWQVPFLKVARAISSSIKSTILSVSLFHHLAGLRSYEFGVTKGKKINAIKAYKRGLDKIKNKTIDPKFQNLGPIIDYLVQNGLTLGKTQDWEGMGQESMLENLLLGGKSTASMAALKTWQAARRKKRSLTTGLFGKLFAGLKAEAAALEFGHFVHLQEKQNKKKGLGPVTDEQMKLAAQQVATLINADFGGLHLSRMGRNPDLQRSLQLILLAPDWTESNWRTVTGMIGFKGHQFNNLINKAIGDNPELPGMEKVYRRFWKGVAIRGLLTVALANAAIMVLFANDDEKDDYAEMLKEQLFNPDEFEITNPTKAISKDWYKGRWASVPIDYVLPESMVDPEKRRHLSVMGHFKDILKIRHPVELLKGKGSPATRAALSFAEGTDWKGARFTTLGEMFEDGIVPKLAVDNKFEKDDSGVTLLSTLLYNIRQSVPIFVSEIATAGSGESTWLSATSRMAGIDLRDVRRVPVAQRRFEEINSEVNDLQKKLDDARKLKDQKMIFEARKDIKKFGNFNTVKARLGSTKSRINIVNRRLKPIELKQKNDIELTAREEQLLIKLRQDKKLIYERALEILER